MSSPNHDLALRMAELAEATAPPRNVEEVLTGVTSACGRMLQWRSEAIGSVLAAHAATAIIASRHGEQLESALNTRDTIGQTKGVIMERFNVDAMRPSEMLRELPRPPIPGWWTPPRVLGTRGISRNAAQLGV